MSSAAADATVLSTTTSPLLGPRVRQREFTLAAGNYRFTGRGHQRQRHQPRLRPLHQHRTPLTRGRTDSVPGR